MSQMGGTFVTAVPAVPVGVMEAFAGSSAPTGWLLCDGTTASRTTYSNLFSVISTTYGVGDGSTTFGLPDMRGRVPMGAGTGNQLNASGSGAILAGTAMTPRTAGAFGGEETHLLSSAEIPAHSHPVSDAGHNHGAIATAGSGGGATVAGWTVGGASAANATNFAYTGSSTTGLTVSNNTGGGGRHAVVSPFVVLNYIIKAIPDTPRGGMTATFTPPIVTSLPLVPQFGDQVAYQFTGTNNVGALLLMQYNGTAWKPLGQATLCRWSSGSASQIINSTTVANLTNGDYNTVTFTPPWDGYYEIGINLENVQLNSGIGLSVLFNSSTNTYSHQLAYFEDANGYTYHTRTPVTGPRTEYLYAAQTYRWKAVITYASGNQGTIFSAGNAYVKAVA